MAARWQAHAEEAGGSRLGGQEKQALALRVSQLAQEMDLSKKGWVSIDDWLHYWTMLPHGSAIAQVNPRLVPHMKQQPTILGDLQVVFETADVRGTGLVSFEDLVELHTTKLWTPQGKFSPPGEVLRRLGLLVPNVGARTFARDLLEAAGDDVEDGSKSVRLNYPQFMAHCVGRERQEVCLHLYDLSQGLAERVSPTMLGRQVEGIWHTGIVVYGYEYYFTRDTGYDQPGQTRFGTPKRVVKMGKTLWRQDELHRFIVDEMKPIFHRDTYDVVSNNCNHFADRICRYLCGKQLPEEVLKQPEYLLASGAVRLITPMLNWYLRDGVVSREPVAEDEPAGVPAAPRPAKKLTAGGERPPTGMVVMMHPVAGTGGPPVLGVVASVPPASPAPLVQQLPMGAGAPQPGGGAAAAIAEDPGVPVRFFDAPGCPGCSSLMGEASRCGTRIEHVPLNRISIVRLEDARAEANYRSALAALLPGTGGGSQGQATAGRSPVQPPGPGGADCGLMLQQRQPRPLRFGDEGSEATVVTEEELVPTPEQDSAWRQMTVAV